MRKKPIRSKNKIEKKERKKEILWNGPDRCCRTCRTWSEWWYWFCRRIVLPKTPACISLKPIPEPSFSFQFPIYLYYCYSTTTLRFFRISGFKIEDLVSYRRAELSRVFISESSSVLFCAWNGYGLFSWLWICDRNDAFSVPDFPFWFL